MNMISPSGQNCQKSSMKECVFVNAALKYSSAMLSKIHSYGLLFRQFFQLRFIKFMDHRSLREWPSCQTYA